MNIALPAIVTFLILLPGFIFRARLKRVERSSLDFSPFGVLVTEAVAWAIFAHAVWLLFSYLITGYGVDVRVLLGLMSGAPLVQAEATRVVANDALPPLAGQNPPLLAGSKSPTS